MPPVEKKQIVCIGHITHDCIITPSTESAGGVHCAGGTAYYVAWAIHQLPKDVSFGLVTAVGPDLRHEVQRLKDAGVDVMDLGSPTSVYFENSYGANMNNRRQRVLSEAAPFTVAQLSSIEADVFHIGTLTASDFGPDVVEYLASKGRVCVDVQGYLRKVVGQRVYAVDWPDKLRVLKCTDILKVNEHEVDVLTDGVRDLRRAARLIASWGVREVLITLGSYGSLIYDGDRFYDIPSYPPHRLVDATGCGDTYAAGYLYARACGASYLEAGHTAAAMCTLKLEHTGPFDSTMDEVRKITNTTLI